MATAGKLADTLDEALWFGEDDPASSDEQAQASMAAEVARISGLKPFPVVATRVLDALNQQDYSVAWVANLIESDPALASMVLRLANSAMYGRAGGYQHVDEAIVRVGGRRVRDMVSAAATMQMFNDLQGIASTFRDHCAATAAIVRVLDQHYELPGEHSLFLAGLLHDIGKLLLAETREFDYTRLSPQDLCTPDVIHRLERQELGYDHAVLGAHVLQAWTIPEPIPKIVAWHHQPTRAYAADGAIGTQVALLRIADRIAWYLAQTLMPAKFPEFLASTAEARWLSLKVDDIEGMWTRMVESRGEIMSIFT
ncbi:MAG: HDOD domain-containing protein [Myxococcales bacterium]|nr:HDOD domain-containing protein [Myxococcales bacterium]